MKRIPKITQENVHIFIPYKVAAIARRLNKDKNMPLNRAVAEFYNSVTYAMLEKEDKVLVRKPCAAICGLCRRAWGYVTVYKHILCGSGLITAARIS